MRRAVVLYAVGSLLDVASSYVGLSTVSWIYERGWVTSILLDHADLAPALLGAKLLCALGIGLTARLLPVRASTIVRLLGAFYGIVFTVCALHNVHLIIFGEPLIHI